MQDELIPVSVTRTKNYDLDSVTQAVWRHFELLHIPDELHSGMRVLIKPNLLLKRCPEEATTTHPAVVEAIIRCLTRLGIHDITIADSPGGPFTKVTLGPIYEASGMTGVAKRTGAALNYDCSSYEKES